MASPSALDRAGICSACSCLVQQHFHPFTNVYRSCAYALRLNQQLAQSGAQAPVQPVQQFQIIRGGRDLAREQGVQ